MTFHAIRMLSPLALAMLAATGCLRFDIDLSDTDGGAFDEDTGDEPEPEPEPEGPAEPTPSDEPLIPGAQWSLRWQPDATIHQIDSGALGLALANNRECALLDAATGELKWTRSRAATPESSALRLLDDALIWAERDGGSWTLNHYDAAGEQLDEVEVEGVGRLAIDDGGSIFAEGIDELIAHTPDGAPTWTVELTVGYGLVALEGLADGVLLLEYHDDVNPLIHARARRYDAAGVELGSVEVSLDFVIATEAAAVGDRVYLGAQGGFGSLPGSVYAIDLAGGLAWTVDLGIDVGVKLAPGPEGGVHALLDLINEPAQLVRVAADGTVTPLGDASTEAIGGPLLHTGAGGELFVGGHRGDVLELHRML
jgi:outer membrane protein assembly factor BamB